MLNQNHVDLLAELIVIEKDANKRTLLQEVAYTVQLELADNEALNGYFSRMFSGADATAYDDTGEFEIIEDDSLVITPTSVLPNTQTISSKAIDTLDTLINLGLLKNDEYPISAPVTASDIEDALVAWEELQDILEDHIWSTGWAGAKLTQTEVEALQWLFAVARAEMPDDKLAEQELDLLEDKVMELLS